MTQKIFFIFFNSGYLKKDPVYTWHYFVPKILRHGDVVIDIGANMGYYSAIFLKSVRKEGKVYCVEPVAPLFRQLEKQLNHRDNIYLIPYALGDRNSDEAIISVPDELRHPGYLRHGCLSLQEGETDADSKYSFPVKIRKGSDLFSGLDRINYVKCDIEGHELIVLKDMKPLLARHRPLVQVEINHTNFDQITALFYSLGYKGYKLIRGRLIDIENLPLQDKLGFDTLFVPAKYFGRVLPFLDQPPAPNGRLAPATSKTVKQPELQSNPHLSS